MSLEAAVALSPILCVSSIKALIECAVNWVAMRKATRNASRGTIMRTQVRSDPIAVDLAFYFPPLVFCEGPLLVVGYLLKYLNYS